MMMSPQRTITPVVGGSTIKLELRTALLKQNDSVSVQFRGCNNQTETVEGAVESADKEKRAVCIVCVTPRMLSACVASMHVSCNGQEFSDAVSAECIFHTQPHAERELWPGGGVLH